MSRTRAAREPNAPTSSRCRPNNLTNNAPETLNRSVICVFMPAFNPICSREISCRRAPTRFAGTINTGKTISESNVSRHSRASIAPRVVASITTFETTLPRVPVTADCAPITSLFSRLIKAPVWVRVKNAIGMFCTLSKSATRRS